MFVPSAKDKFSLLYSFPTTLSATSFTTTNISLLVATSWTFVTGCPSIITVSTVFASTFNLKSPCSLCGGINFGGFSLSNFSIVIVPLFAVIVVPV